MSQYNKIDVDFEMMMMQASILERIAEQMETLGSKSFDTTLQSIAASWKGDNANLYLGKGEILKSNTITTAQNLRDIAGRLKSRTQFIYSKEKAAIEIAVKRTY
ncbi:hypothetical protein QTL86_16565 [Cellulosilyticum sp. ST5]|uniref:WXG100 family type VII secretion target n=1 Tax=unclassified Cellulosilyticum TaxID=2643091 RepID=UPI000F8F479A|nr:hypothetical protein [Cellulosilyticum sp. WCF-2]QEH67693.1 hypothetical protein EKH84_04495 [Cellulosilyticum sp. WCF-2]